MILVDGQQNLLIRHYPVPGKKGYKKRLRYTGQKEQGMKILTRNAFFEPSFFPGKDFADEALNRIEKAFNSGKPAIVGSHRINYMGSLSEQNRMRNLDTLKRLLAEVIKKWPEVEFMSSNQLVNLINIGDN